MTRLVVCGPTTVDAPDAPTFRPKERAVLAALAFEHPAVASVDRIIDLVWAGRIPATARKALHNHVTRIRQVAPDLVVTDPAGYRLADDVDVDLRALEAKAVLDSTEPGRALDSDDLARVLATTDGTPFADLPGSDEVLARRRRHHRARAATEDLLVLALLAENRDAAAADAAQRLVDDDPYRERRWWLLAVALTRTGRRREALGAVNRARQYLTGTGLDLGADLQALERLIITGDPVVLNTAILARPETGGVIEPPAGPVGAEPVLDRVRSWLADQPSGRALVLAGQAGAGKSTIARAAVAEALRRDMSVFVAACDPDPAVPLQPVAELLDRLAERDPEAFRRADLAPLGVLSPAVAGLVGTPEGTGDHHDLLGAVRRAFAGLGRPTLVVIEDVHWAPPLTLQAIGAVVASGSPVVILTSRPTGTDLVRLVAADTVELPPWSVDDVGQWLAGHEADPVRRAAAAIWLHQQTGGIPMFVRELTLALLDENRLGPAAAGRFAPLVDVPPAILAALAARVERLGPAGRRALEAAAVLGAHFPADVLADLAGVDRVGIDEARQARMLLAAEADGRDLVFEHELLRRVALGRLAPAAQAEIHHLALAALDARGDTAAATRARHAVGAASIDAGRAVQAADAAARAAGAGFAHAEAGDWWLVAADVLAQYRPGDRAERCELRIRAGQALLHAGDPRAAAVLFDAAADAEERGDWPAAARAAIAVCRLGPTSTAGRPHDDARSLSDRLLDRIDDPGLRAALAAATTMVHSMGGAVERCRALYDQAERDAATAGSDRALADVLPFSYMSLSAPDDLDRRERIADRLAGVAGRLGRLDSRWSALHLRFSNQLQRGDPGLRATAAELVDLTRRVRERQREWEEHYVRATVAHLDDDLDTCEATITASLQYADTVAESRVLAVYGVHLLALRHTQRRLDELVEVIAGLAADQPEVGAWQAALALAAAQAGEAGRATAAFDAVTGRGTATLDRDYSYTGALVALGEAAVLLGDAERAGIVEPLLAPWSSRWSWVGTCTLGPVDTTLAGLAAVRGDREAAARWAGRAVASTARLAAPGFGRLAASRQPV